MPAEHPIETVFPKLPTSDYRITSPASLAYNCIAWAIGVSDRRYDPALGFDWPDGVPRSANMSIAVALFKHFGFEDCDTSDPETGFEKIVLYGLADQFKHVARLLINGYWTSKLGSEVDIEHRSPDDLAGTVYGHVVCYMRRETG